MQANEQTQYRALRRAYELGRVRTSLRRATFFGGFAAAIAWLVVGRGALVWVPIVIGVLAMTEWRGMTLMKGTRRGFIAGVAAMLIPMSVLRPCCASSSAVMGETSCCVQTCWVSGTLLGLLCALLIPKANSSENRWQGAAGVALGMLSVTAIRCSSLIVGEAAGLLAGLTTGVAAASLTRAWWDRRVAA